MRLALRHPLPAKATYCVTAYTEALLPFFYVAVPSALILLLYELTGKEHVL